MFEEPVSLGNLATPCPVCGSTVQKQDKVYKCTGQQCGFRVYRAIAGRVFTDDEVEKLLKDKKLPPVFGFKSKRGHEYGAGLILKKTGDVEMFFED